MMIMGSGNTKNGLRKDEKIAVKNEKQEKPRQQDDNKPPNNQEKIENLLNTVDQAQKEPKEHEEKKSVDSDGEGLQPVEDVILEVSEKGFSDPTLIAHCEKTPKYLGYFTSIYEAIKDIEEIIKGEDILSIQRQATVISSSYSKVKRKTALGNFLAEIGFARIFKEIYLKLDSGFPELLTYDRELDENLKKPSDVENESSKVTGTVNKEKIPDKQARESCEKPTVSSDNTTVSGIPNISCDQPSETSVNTAKLNVEPTEASTNSVTANNQVTGGNAVGTPVKSAEEVEASPTAAELNGQPNEGLSDAKQNEQPEDPVQHSNSTEMPTNSNNHKPTYACKLENLVHQNEVNSVQTAASSKQPEEATVTENIDKHADTEEKKSKPSSPLLKAQDLFNKFMLSAINYTDACDNMNIALSEEGVVQLLVNAVAKLKDCTGQHVKYMNEEGGLKKRTVRGGILTKVMGTLHNLSKRVLTRPNFHACDTIKIILPLIDDEVNRFAIDALLIIAYLIDEENNNLIMANEGPIKYLISMINKATKKTIHKYLGYTNSELAQGLAQIAINDHNKKQIVACGAIPVLTHMIEAAKIDNERITAAEALWMLAFDQDNRETMKKDEKCMNLLNQLKESKNVKIKKAASGALWEIEGKQKVTTGSLTDAATTNHVMISYQWDVQKTLIQVKDRLQAAGYRVWMDLEQMGGSTLEAMARAVENSTVVLVCVSQKYKESSNCRSEAEYAFQLKKDIIPLMMDRNYKPDGWLGMIMGSKLWIDFSQRTARLDNSMRDLQKELGDRGKGDAEIVQVSSVDVVDATPSIDISGWTSDDVIDWMKGFGIVLKKKNPRLSDKLTGPVLARLHSLRNESPDFYYSSLKEDIGLSDVFDVMLFTDELEKLVG